MTFIEKCEEKKRERLVTASELKRIGAALRVAAKREAPAAIACVAFDLRGLNPPELGTWLN